MRSLWAFLVAFPLTVSAATNFVVPAADGTTTQIHVDDPNAARIVVEFRDAPLFARPLARSATSTSSAMKAFDARFAQFAADVRPFAPHITNTYRRVFAGASMTVPRSAIPQLARLNYVRRIHEDRIVHTLAETGVSKINADQVWTTFGTRGAGIVVAVIDTGIDYTHPALGGSFGPGSRVAGGWDFVNKDSDPMDDNGHGTHVAGIIGADSNTLTGVAPEVTFLAYKVLSAQGSGLSSDVIAAIERAADPDQDGDPSDHVAVANMSLGGGAVPDDPVVQAVETATAAGVVFSVAAGNSGGFFTVSSPAIAPSAIAVGATDLADQMAKFSSGGPGPALAIKPEVVAPGVAIISTKLGGGQIAYNGTSMAAPHVAGVAALVKAVHPDWSPADIKAAIVTTAQDLGIDVMAQGAGRVDALRAAGVDVIASPPVLPLGRDGAASSTWTSSGTIALTNRSSGELTIHASATGARNGVTVTVTPAALTLQPGQTHPVTIAIAVDNALVPFPQEGSLALSGNVVFDGGASPIHVPWAVERAASITTRYETQGVTSLVVVGINGTPHVRYANNPFGASSTELLVPPGTYVVELADWKPDEPASAARVIFARRTVSEDVTLELSAAMAATLVSYDSRDDVGRLLYELGKGGVCWDSVFFTLPSDSPIPWTLLNFAQSDGTPFLVRISALPEGVGMTGSETCSDGSSLWIAQHGSIEATGDRVEAGADPQSWVRVRVKIAAPPNLTNPKIVLGRALVTRSMQKFMVLVEGSVFPVAAGDWSGTVFITREAHPWLNTGAWLRMDSFEASPTIEPPVLRATTDGIVLSPDRTAAPTTYIAQPGEPIAFGSGPVHPYVNICVADGALSSGGGWIGSLDEDRTIDRTERWILSDSSGTIVKAGWPPGPFTLPGAGVYHLEFGRDAIIGGALSEATLTARFDSHLTDTSPPALDAFRIVDSLGHDTAFVNRDSDARLKFAAIDIAWSSDCRTSKRGLVAAGRTSVSWRSHGATTWQPLDAVVEATELTNTEAEYYDLGHYGIGTLFATNLRMATQTANPVDLRVHVEDESGNAIDYVLAPAFTVTPDARRHSVRR